MRVALKNHLNLPIVYNIEGLEPERFRMFIKYILTPKIRKRHHLWKAESLIQNQPQTNTRNIDLSGMRAVVSEKTPDKSGYSFRQKIDSIQNDLNSRRKVSFKADGTVDPISLSERPEIGIMNQEAVINSRPTSKDLEIVKEEVVSPPVE